MKHYRTEYLNCLLACILLVIATSCGKKDSVPQAVDNYVPGNLEFEDKFFDDLAASTVSESVYLRGIVINQIEASEATIIWINSTTNSRGPADTYAGVDEWGIPTLYWGADVPLQMGDNDITFRMTVSNAYQGTWYSDVSISIRRIPPANLAVQAVHREGTPLDTITWEAYPGATSYNVYFWDLPDGYGFLHSHVLDVASPYVIDTSKFSYDGVWCGAGCYYLVRAVRNGVEIAEYKTVRALSDAPPRIVGTQPKNGAAGVPVNAPITITFSESMDCTTINADTFVLSDSAGLPVSSVVLCSGTTATLSPTTNLMMNEHYKAGITAKESGVGGFTASGTFEFATGSVVLGQWGTRDIECSFRVVTGQDGAVYVLTSSENCRPGYSLLGRSSVRKFDSNGVMLWTKPLVLDKFYQGDIRDIAVGSNGDVYITGYASSAVESYSKGIFIVKYGANGSTQWIQHSGSTYQDQATNIAVDGDGNIYVAGYTFAAYPAQGGADIFVVKFDPNGIETWKRYAGSSQDDYGGALAIDSTGNVYVTGYTSGAFDGNSSAGKTDIVVIKYDKMGTQQWTRQIGTADYDYANSITIDRSDNVYVSGTISVKYDSLGNRQWFCPFGGLLTIDADGNANIYVGGSTDVMIGGDYDITVNRFDANGSTIWSKQMGTSADDYVEAIAIDSNQNLYVTGITYGSWDGKTQFGDGDAFLLKIPKDAAFP